MERLIG